jgi:hypothetical protein
MMSDPTPPSDDDEVELTPDQLPIPPVGAQRGDDPDSIPPDEGDAESGARP